MTVPRQASSPHQSKLKVNLPDADGAKTAMGILWNKTSAAALLFLLWFSLSVSSTPGYSDTNSLAGASGWTMMNSDANATNYVPQNQVDATNVQNLQVAWTFPFPSVPTVPGLAVTGQGSISPPLVVNGTAYLVTNYLTVYAVN